MTEFPRPGRRDRGHAQFMAPFMRKTETGCLKWWQSANIVLLCESESKFISERTQVLKNSRVQDNGFHASKPRLALPVRANNAFFFTLNKIPTNIWLSLQCLRGPNRWLCSEYLPYLLPSRWTHQYIILIMCRSNIILTKESNSSHVRVHSGAVLI